MSGFIYILSLLTNTILGKSSYDPYVELCWATVVKPILSLDCRRGCSLIASGGFLSVSPQATDG